MVAAPPAATRTAAATPGRDRVNACMPCMSLVLSMRPRGQLSPPAFYSPACGESREVADSKPPNPTPEEPTPAAPTVQLAPMLHAVGLPEAGISALTSRNLQGSPAS